MEAPPIFGQRDIQVSNRLAALWAPDYADAWRGGNELEFMDFLADARRERNSVLLPDGRRVSRFSRVARLHEGNDPQGSPPPTAVGDDLRSQPIPETSVALGPGAAPARTRPRRGRASVRWDRVPPPSGENRLTPADEVRQTAILVPAGPSSSQSAGDGPQGPASGRPTQNKMCGRRPLTPPPEVSPRGTMTQEDLTELPVVEQPRRVVVAVSPASSRGSSPRFPQGLTRPPGSSSTSPATSPRRPEPMVGGFWWHRQEQERREEAARRERPEQMRDSRPSSRPAGSDWRPHAPPRLTPGTRDPRARGSDRPDATRGPRDRDRDRDRDVGPRDRDRDRTGHDRTRRTRPRR